MNPWILKALKYKKLNLGQYALQSEQAANIHLLTELAIILNCDSKILFGKIAKSS